MEKERLMKDIMVTNCPVCGWPNLSLRIDKRGRPYLLCTICSTRIFPRTDDGVFGVIGIMNVVAKHPELRNEISEEASRAKGEFWARVSGTEGTLAIKPVEAPLPASKIAK